MSEPSLLLATANAHKLREYRALLDGVPATLRYLRDVGIEGLPEEEGETFEENALEKARFCARSTGLLSLADDSGLEVDSLNGFPGVRSNRWAGPDKTDADRVRLLLERMQGTPESERGARFVCVVAVVTPEGAERTFEGILDGRLAMEPRGTGGFGYDPIMYVPELGRTVAELSDGEKNTISHRARATHAARPWLLDYLRARRS